MLPAGQDPVEQLVANSTNNLAGQYAIYIKDLKSGKSYEVSSDEQIASASLYKLAVLWKTYDAVEKNEFKKDDLVSLDKIAIDKILEEKSSNQEGPQLQTDTEPEVVSYTVAEALRLMITISDNYSAILLSEKLGWQNIDSLMEKENLAGIDLTDGEVPTVTAKAVGDLLERIYRNTAVTAKDSQEMKTLLLAQKVNDRIPKYLPTDIKVAHKTGELDTLRHDAGIVYGKNSHYIFVFLSDTPTPKDASEEIAQLSKKFFDALEQQ